MSHIFITQFTHIEVTQTLRSQFESRDSYVTTCQSIQKFEMEIVQTEVSLPLLFGGEKNKKLAFILDNVLTEAECSDLIKITEDQGYEPALVNVGGGRQQLLPEVRNKTPFVFII